MFKIESYITPIILNHVAKYVKNIRPQDAQVSLWEGEVAFQNLDLRLDVLEEELQMPFELLSGHIHELSIRVPWTKITSEPIKITINTIEFVLKLRTEHADVSSAGSSPHHRSTDASVRRSRISQEQPPLQQSTISGLVSKIINNIIVECQNIILKYVEDDIVVSMNVQLLSFSSADEKWRVAMADVQPVSVLLRKLVKVSDLTICVDKRNAAGHIDVCQEPVLYRCSLEVRFLYKYNLHTKDISSMSRLALFTKSMDMNISSLQFPMTMRLIKMIIALANSKAIKHVSSELFIEVDEELAEAEKARESLFSRAWNMLPTFNNEINACDVPTSTETPGHMKEFAIYIEQLNFTLKNSEFVVDSIMGNTKRIRYTPVVRMTLGGLYLEKLNLEEVGWSNAKAGLSYITVEPLGPYGSSEEFSSNTLLNSVNQEMSAFTDKSLFDENCSGSERGWCITNYDDYMGRFTDDYLSYRGAILAFDSVEYRQSKPKDPTRESMETSKETYTNFRLLSAGVAFRWNRSFLQVKHFIQDLIDSYDYPAYYADKLDPNASGGGGGGGGGSPKLHPPLMEDYDALMQYIPICIYRFDLKNISLEIHGQVEPDALQKTQRRLPSALKHIPYFIVHFGHLEGTLCTPIDGDKLVHTTCQLPNKPLVLIEACYMNYVINAKQLSLSLVNKGTKRSTKLLHIPQLNLVYGDLLKPQLWDEDTIIPQRKCELNCALLKMEFTKRDLIDSLRLIECILSYRPYLLWKIAKPIPSNINEAVTLVNLFDGLKLSFQRYATYTTCSARLQSLQSELEVRGGKSVQKHPVLQTELNVKSKNWLHGQMQYTVLDVADERALFVAALWLEPFRIFADMNLLEFLKYQEEHDFNNERDEGSEFELTTQYLQSQGNFPQVSAAAVPTGTVSTGAGTSAPAPPLMRRSSRNSLPSRKISQPEETIHFSSERDEKLCLDPVNVSSHASKGADPKVMWDYLSSLILSIEIAEGRIDVAEKFKLNKDYRIVSPYTEVQLPRITFKSTNADGVSRTNLLEKFTPRTNYRDNVNWVIALYELSIKKHLGDVTEVILAETYTTITIAITHKTENQKGKLPNSGLPGQEHVEPGTEVNAAAPVEMLPVPEAAEPTGTAVTNLKEIDTINIHVDTTPICFYISEPKCKMLLAHLSLLSTIINLMLPMTRPTQQPKPPPRLIQIVPATEENSKIKQFLDLETNSEHSVAIEQKTVPPSTVSMLCQWTIARIVVELESARHIRKSKIILELEDLLATVDKREDFSKYTSKVGQFNLNYYEPRPRDGWVEQTYLRVKMFGETADMPFLNVIYTCVSLKNYYSRIGVKRKCDMNRCISEILITMQAIEMVIDLDRLPEFIGSLCVFMTGSNSKNNQRNETVANPITADDLPLIHLDSKGMTIYMPLDTGKTSCTVLIWKIESMKVTPNVENPLQRTPIRADVYSKAAQLGFLTTPGAIVEDRQYEFVIRNISAASGSWDEILNLLHEKAKTFYDTNPALEWNNQNRGSQTSLQIMDIFNDFTFSCTFAPCITYNNILICGQAIEFNCASDFVANLNTSQLNLLSCMVTTVANIESLIEETCHKSKTNKTASIATSCSSESASTTYVSVRSSTSLNRYIPVEHSSQQFKDALGSSTVFDSIDEDTENNVKTDSGFQSSRSRKQNVERPPNTSQLDRNDTNHYIPHTVSLVAGIFVINIFHLQGEMLQLDAQDLVPLFSLTVSQPSFMLTQSIHDFVTQTSLFNMTISTLDATVLEEGSLQPFTIVVFDTLPGELSATGIPPPLCTLKTHHTKLNTVEADIEVSKPILVTLDEAQLLLVLRNAVTIYEALIESNCFSVRTAKAVLRASKIQIMRHEFFHADRIHLKVVKIIVIFKHDGDYHCKAVCAESQGHLKFLARPEKANFSAVIGSFHVQTGHKIFLHPTTLRVTLNLVSEPWYSLPLVIATAKFSVVHLDVGVYGLRELRNAIEASKRVNGYFSSEWKKFLLNRPSMGKSFMQRDRLVLITKHSLIPVPQKRCKKKKSPREEYYQDDLRAGAFQFVEMATDAFLPLPYQIQIIRKDFGIICWRYPQPRKMVKIHIFPVPMAKPIHIKCRMEYFSEPHECFLHFCDFWLSETVSKQITLPERDICSNIWRVVILQSLISVNGECFDTSEEEDDKEKVPRFKIEDIFTYDRKDSDFVLHPRVLVGCMRIDTSFYSANVPKVQLLATCAALQIKLLNQPNENSGLPPMLKHYRLSHTTQISQTFLVILLERLSFHAAFISKQIYTADSSMTLSLKCLDYGFLNMLPLMEESTLQCCVQVNDVKGILNVNAVVDKIRLNLGPTIIHTLLSSKAHWEELLDLNETRQRDALIPKCVVVNRTYSHVSFGQTGTAECIQLQPLECELYYFCSDNHNQELTFVIVDNETNISETSQSVPIYFRFEGDSIQQSIRIGDKCLFITSRKLSATQIIVLIKGQIEVLSMVPHDLRMDLQCVDQKQEDKQPAEYMIENKSRASFYFSVQRNSNITMRLKFTNAKGKGRTGDIPLRQNKKLPWLVKVPTTNSEFVSLWVRIVREDVLPLRHATFEPQRILVTIWPIFEVRSMLPCPVSAEESITKDKSDLAPAGGSHVFSVPATHLTEHTIAFKYSFPLNSKSQSEYTLSLKNMEWNTFFWYDEQAWTINDALYKLLKEPPSKWPLDDEEELRVQRFSVNTTKADVRYNCSAAREFSCTTCLEVSPWGIFINSTGCEVSICDCETQLRVAVNSNGLEMLPSFSSAFTVDLPCDAGWISSLPIYYKSKAPPNSGTRCSCVLPQNGSIDIVLLRNNEIFKFVLEVKVIDCVQHVFKLRPKYAAMNFTNMPLQVLSFAMDHKESAVREALEKLDADVEKLELDPIESVTDCIGCTLDNFYDLKVSPKSNRSRDTAFVFFVCIKVSEYSDISIPIPLSMTFTRRCFSIQNGSDSVPLVVTLIEKDRIFYLNIFNDVTPAILVNNQTDVKFVIAQTSASENSRVTNTTPEYEGRHFEWFQLLPAYSQCYYTPPELYASFPDVESTMCNLTLALCDEKPTKKTLKWSKPIRTDKTWEKFLHIPNHGDVKVIICDKHRVIQVFIYYIAQMEFSVKDLRSRLLTPEPSATGQADNADSHDISESNSIPSLTPSIAIADTKTLLATPSKCMHFSNVCEMKTLLKVRFFVKEILLSLHTDAKEHDFIKDEIFGMYVDDFVMAYDDDEDRRELSVLLPNLQIDNQIYSSGKYDFPVVLCAQELYERTAIVPSVHYLDRTYNCLNKRTPMGRFTFKFFQDEMKLSSIVCGLSPVRAYIEDAYLNHLLDAIVECAPSNCAYKPEQTTERIVLAKGQLLLPRDVAAQAICIAEPLQLRSFEIQPLNILLSVHTSLRLYIALDHSPLSFSTYNRQQILTMPLRFGQSLGMHYLSGAIFGAGWVVGSLEILGSPSGLARSFSTGLRDFVSMPMEGLFRGPWGFVVGVTQGSASLLRNITAGTVNSVTKLASSVARNLDRLTLDQEHIERTEALRRCRPQGFTDGFSQGVTGLGISILGAVGGLARHTLEARSPVEVVTGMGKGIVGALTKPISGAAELLALAGQGMLHTVGFNAMPDQRAPSIRQKMATEPSAYRIWKLLPSVLKSDQILFNHEVTLVVQDQLRHGYAFLTSAVFAIMEAQSDSLACVFPIGKIEMTCDCDDKSLYYIHLVKDKEDADEDINYTNQRIMTFLHSSYSLKFMATTESFADLLHTHEQEFQANRRRKLDWAFYISDVLGEHIMNYLKIMNRNC